MAQGPAGRPSTKPWPHSTSRSASAETSSRLETLAETVTYERAQWPLDEYPLSAQVLRTQEAVQVMIGDPEAERTEVELLLALGYGSLLLVPIVRAGESVGVIEAYCRAERAWARTDINRARIISNQFAPLIEDLAPRTERSAQDPSSER